MGVREGLWRKAQSKGHLGRDLHGEQGQAGEECPGEVSQGAGSTGWETDGRSGRQSTLRGNMDCTRGTWREAEGPNLMGTCRLFSASNCSSVLKNK